MRLSLICSLLCLVACGGGEASGEDDDDDGGSETGQATGGGSGGSSGGSSGGGSADGTDGGGGAVPATEADLWDTRWRIEPAVEISCSGVSDGFTFSEVTFREYDVDVPNTNLRVVPDWSWPPDIAPFNFFGYYEGGRFTDEWQHVAYCVFDFETEWTFTSGDRFEGTALFTPRVDSGRCGDCVETTLSFTGQRR